MSVVMPTSPVKVTLTVGKQYAWSLHEGEGIVVDCTKGCVTFTADRTEAFICTCKKTGTPPFCDGSHKTVKDG